MELQGINLNSHPKYLELVRKRKSTFDTTEKKYYIIKPK
ncbi:hypothetical protein ES703_56211 [subsurface metagenome]